MGPHPAPHSSLGLRHGGGWVRVSGSGSSGEGSMAGGLRVASGGGGSRVDNRREGLTAGASGFLS